MRTWDIYLEIVSLSKREERLHLRPKVYLSGPMSGIAEHNYPAFMAAQRAIEEEGFIVLNPANNDASLPRWQLMSADVDHVLRCDALVVLPGWMNSLGASTEVNVGLEAGKRIIDYETREDVSDRLMWKPWLELGPSK